MGQHRIVAMTRAEHYPLGIVDEFFSNIEFVYDYDVGQPAFDSYETIKIACRLVESLGSCFGDIEMDMKVKSGFLHSADFQSRNGKLTGEISYHYDTFAADPGRVLSEYISLDMTCDTTASSLEKVKKLLKKRRFKMCSCKEYVPPEISADKN